MTKSKVGPDVAAQDTVDIDAANKLADGFRDISGEQDETAEAVQAVLNERVDPNGWEIERLLTRGENPELFRYFISLARRINMDLVLHIDVNSTVRLFRSQLGLKNILVIPQIDVFVQEMEALYLLFEEHYISHVNLPDQKHQYSFDKVKHGRFFEMFLDTTPSDWESLSSFFARRNQELLNGPVIEWNSVRTLANGQMILTSSTSGQGMEGYFQVSSFYMIEGERVALSEVRYGILSTSEAVIYSLQNPEIDGYSSASIEIELQRLVNLKGQLEVLCKGLATPPPFFRSEVIDDEKLLDFYAIGWEAANLKLIGFGITPAQIQLFSDYVQLLEEKPLFEAVIKKFEVNKEAVRTINKTLRRGLPDKLGSIKNVPGQAFLALLGTIKVLHNSGIRTIRIPMKLPLCFSFLQEEIAERIYNGKLNLVKRLIFELEGVEANTEGFVFNLREILRRTKDGRDYLFVELVDVIRPKREVIQDIWNG